MGEEPLGQHLAITAAWGVAALAVSVCAVAATFLTTRAWLRGLAGAIAAVSLLAALYLLGSAIAGTPVA
jgi:hypothetical protein